MARTLYEQIAEPSPRPEPAKMFSSWRHGLQVLCAGNILYVSDKDSEGAERQEWYRLTDSQVDEWVSWASWTAGKLQVGGLSWPQEPT